MCWKGDCFIWKEEGNFIFLLPFFTLLYLRKKQPPFRDWRYWSSSRVSPGVSGLMPCEVLGLHGDFGEAQDQCTPLMTCLFVMDLSVRGPCDSRTHDKLTLSMLHIIQTWEKPIQRGRSKGCSHSSVLQGPLVWFLVSPPSVLCRNACVTAQWQKEDRVCSTWAAVLPLPPTQGLDASLCSMMVLYEQVF